MSRSALLVFFSELGPVLVFFIAGRFFDFYTATLLFMIATAIAVTVSWIIERRIPVLPIISALFVLLGGFITVIYEAPDAIIFADSLYYLLISVALAVALYWRIPLFKTVFGSVFGMSDTGWRKLTWRWMIFLFLAAIANEVVRAVATPEFWIDYRFFKTVAVIAFSTYQFTLSHKYRIASETNTLGLRV